MRIGEVNSHRVSAHGAADGNAVSRNRAVGYSQTDVLERAVVALPTPQSEFRRRLFSANEVSMRDRQAFMTGTSYQGRDFSNWPLFDQHAVAGDPNACGPTALAMVLASEGLIGRDLAAARALDGDVRLRSLRAGTSATDLANAAQARGLPSSTLNNAGFGELTAALKRGNHVMAMIDSGASPHWVNVLGTRTDTSGNTFVVMADPARGRVVEMPKAEFEARWKKPFTQESAFVGSLMGQSNVLVLMDKNGRALPPTRLGNSVGTETAIDGFTDVVKAFGAFERGSFGTGLRGMLGGAFKLSIGLPAFMGAFVEGTGAQLRAWGERLTQKDNIFAKIAGHGLKFGGAVTEAVGSVARSVGNVVAEAGNKVKKFFKKLF